MGEKEEDDSLKFYGALQHCCCFCWMLSMIIVVSLSHVTLLSPLCWTRHGCGQPAERTVLSGGRVELLCQADLCLLWKAFSYILKTGRMTSTESLWLLGSLEHFCLGCKWLEAAALCPVHTLLQTISSGVAGSLPPSWGRLIRCTELGLESKSFKVGCEEVFADWREKPL